MLNNPTRIPLTEIDKKIIMSDTQRTVLNHDTRRQHRRQRPDNLPPNTFMTCHNDGPCQETWRTQLKSNTNTAYNFTRIENRTRFNYKKLSFDKTWQLLSDLKLRIISANDVTF